MGHAGLIDLGTDAIRMELEVLFKRSYGRILPRLIRLAGDFGHAEDALQHAFAAAWSAWLEGERPRNPEAWLLSVAQRRLLDGHRRAGLVGSASLEALQGTLGEGGGEMVAVEEGLEGEDDSLSLIFTCCHPALAQEVQVALTLNSLCGLTSAEIAAAFLVPSSTMAQRLVRVKAKIRDAGIPFRIPPSFMLAERLPQVLSVFYLVFSTGYSAPSGDTLMRTELCEEALRLTRLLLTEMPDDSELKGLLALMLLQHARAGGRTNAKGDLILLEDQDRSLWDQDLIAEGHGLLMEALDSGQLGAYQLQAAIAGVHSASSSYADTDWMQILLLYGQLMRQQPSPVIELNRAVALAMAKGPAEGLSVVEELQQEGSLEGYLYLHSTRAELLQRLGRAGEARDAWLRALELAQNTTQRDFLRGRLAELER